jgi:hypothetical protein
LERLFEGVLVVGNCGASHFDVVTAEEEQESVAAQANDVRHEHELHCAFWLELESLEETATDEDPDASAGNGDGTGKDTGLALA